MHPQYKHNTYILGVRASSWEEDAFFLFVCLFVFFKGPIL